MFDQIIIDILSSARRQRRTMWRPGLYPSLEQRTILRKQNITNTSITLPVTSMRTEYQEIIESMLESDSGGLILPRNPSQRQETLLTAARTMYNEENLDQKPCPRSENQNSTGIPHFTSSGSETTLWDDSGPDTSQVVHNKKDAEASAASGPEIVCTSVSKRRLPHLPDISIPSGASATHSPKLSLGERARMNDGMLKLKANSTKNANAEIRTNRHWRKLSLNIPIRPAHGQLAHVESTASGDMSAHKAPFYETRKSLSMSLQERELEYKHRHTYIGTASLDDFLETLYISSEHTVSKRAIIKAFVSLAATEQQQARLDSTDPNGWELVSRITPDVSSVDYVAQSQVKLGSISLRQFLDLIPFNGMGEIGALLVVEAFYTASHMDAKVEQSPGSKARNLRAWMLSQSNL